MLRPITWLVLVATAAIAALVADALHLNSIARFGLLLVVMVAASLTDRDRFYGADLRRVGARRTHL